MFDIDDSKFPRTWSEFSLDYKLFFINHGAMMLMMVLSGVLPGRISLLLILVWSAFLIQRAISNRRARKWAWPGAEPKHVLAALLSLFLGGFFLAAIMISFTAGAHVMIPIISAVVSLVLLGVLQSLNLVALSEAEFATCCEGRRPEPKTAEAQPLWKRTARAAVMACFLAVWIAGVGSFMIQSLAARSGSPVRTDEKSIEYTDNGVTVYISPGMDRARTGLGAAASAGMPVAMILVLFAQFVLGIKMFPHAKSLPELWKDRPWARKT